MKFYLFLVIYLKFEIYFLEFPFWCCLKELFIFLAFSKCKSDCYILKVIRVKGFCPLKTEIARFSSDLVLIVPTQRKMRL